MARMIDADRLLRELTALSHGQVWPGWTYDGIRLLIERQPTLTQPNEPLTLDELRGMDGEPVWVDDKKTWALLQVWDDENIDAVFPMPRGCFHAESVIGRKIYRRPPEGEEET